MGAIKNLMLNHQGQHGLEDDYYETDHALLDMAIEAGHFPPEEDSHE